MGEELDIKYNFVRNIRSPGIEIVQECVYTWESYRYEGQGDPN